MADTQQPKPPAVNNFGSCESFDLWVDVFSHSISDADTFHADLLKARVRAMKSKRAQPPPAVTLDLRTGQWSVDADMTPTRARTLAQVLIEAADIVDQFTAHQAEEAELARFNAGPVYHPIDLPCGVVAFEPVTEGGAA